GLAMYMHTGSAATVGIFTSFQYLAGIAVSWLVGRRVVPASRKRTMGWAVVILLAGGCVIAWDIQVATLVVFGFLRSIAEPMYMLPYSSIRLDIIDRSARDPAERIEYMCASEVPLALGRVAMMVLLLLLSGALDELGLRIALFVLCANRVLTYLIIIRTNVV